MHEREIEVKHEGKVGQGESRNETNRRWAVYGNFYRAPPHPVVLISNGPCPSHKWLSILAEGEVYVRVLTSNENASKLNFRTLNLISVHIRATGHQKRMLNS